MIIRTIKTILPLICILFAFASLSSVYAQNALTEAEKRIEQKEQDLNTLDWLKKKKSLRQDIQERTSNFTPPKKTIKETPAWQEDYSRIGLLDLRNGGFNNTIWRSYDKQSLEQDFKNIISIFNDDKVYPSQREILKALLLTKADAPRGFSTDEFFIYRLNVLIDLGMADAALNLFTDYISSHAISQDEKIISKGLETLILNNEYESACLLLKAYPIKDDTNKLNQAVKSECARLYNKDQAIRPLVFLNMINAPKTKFSESRLNLKTKFKNASIAHAYLMEDETPSSVRKSIFKSQIDKFLVQMKELDLLYKQDSDFIKIAKQNFLPLIEGEGNTYKRLELIEKQVISNGNPANPISKFYESYVNSIKPNEKYLDFSYFLYRFFYLNGDEYRSKKWENLIKNNEESLKNNGIIKKYEKKSPFFIFPLAHYKNFMLQIDTALDINMEKSHINTVKSVLVKSFQSQCFSKTLAKNKKKNCPEIQTLNLKTFNPETSNMLRRFMNATNDSNNIHDVKAETVILSVPLWDNMINKSQGIDDLEKNVNFILHSLTKSDLNYYVFAFGRDMTSKSK